MRQRLKSSFFLVALAGAVRQVPLDVRRAKWCLGRGRLIVSYFSSHSTRKLQIGSGFNLLDGWLNTDFYPRSPQQAYLDATKPFPFPAASFDYVFSEHVIEHLKFRAGMSMLRECHRILKPGGRIRISTPNLENIAALETKEHSELQRKYIEMSSSKYIPENEARLAAFVINNFFWDFGHYFVYDPQSLEWALTEAGFVQPKRWEPGKSDDANLNAIESHGKIIGDEMNRFETMVLEAVRP